MPSNKYPSCNQTIEKEMGHFLRLKEKETERSRSRALEAMMLLEQRNRGESLEEAEKVMPKPNVKLAPEYTDDGKLKFSPEEMKKVQRLRDYKAGRIESYLKKQSANEKRNYFYLNQRFPFVMKDEQEKSTMFSRQLQQSGDSRFV